MPPFAHVTAEEYHQCPLAPSRIVDTRLGPVEYAERGEGPVLITVHGCPGGYDQSLVLGEVFRKNGYKIVGVSRPGYLGTPLSSGPSQEDQGDLLAAFIEAMGFERVGGIGASAGGPALYMLAQRHPEVLTAMVQIDSVAIRYQPATGTNKLEEDLYFSPAGVWIVDWFMRHFPSTVVKSFLTTGSSLDKHALGERVGEVVRDPDKLAVIQALTACMSRRVTERREGATNDLAAMSAMDRLPLDQVACPTLIFSGDMDSDVPIGHAEYAHQAVAGSDFYVIRGGSHIGFWIADTAAEAQRHAVEWLRVRMPAR